MQKKNKNNNKMKEKTIQKIYHYCSTDAHREKKEIHFPQTRQYTINFTSHHVCIQAETGIFPMFLKLYIYLK